jgi:hypothetical protein
VLEIFDEREADLIARVLETADRDERGASAPLRQRIELLTETAALLARMPLGSQEEILEQLGYADRYAGDLGLPAKAGFARAFLVAKIELLKACRGALTPARRDLSRALRTEVTQSVFTLLAEELLRSLIYDRELSSALRRRAGGLLFSLWDAADLVEIDDFCPVLEMAWNARTRAGSIFGSLLGTAEYFQLVQHNCPEAVLSFFSRSEVPEEESQAFQEFLLGLPWDDVVRLRERMKGEGRSVIDGNYALSELTLAPSQLQKGDPEALYASFRRRMHHTELRKSLRQPGPTRTAEAYLLVHLLSQ